MYGDDVVTGLRRHLSENALEAIEEDMGPVASTAMATVRRELAAKLSRFLELELTAVAAAGWDKHRELLDAARRTTGPDAEAQVDVPLTHEMLLTRHPTVDVLVGSNRIFSIDVELEVRITVTGVKAVVRAGRITALGGGECGVDVTLPVEGVEIDRRHRSLESGVLLPLRGGIPLGLPRQRSR
jgi:hypothetical protein